MKHGSITTLESQIGRQLSGKQMVKTVQSDQKPKFCDAHGILSIHYLEKGRTVKSKYYMALLVRLKEEIAKKRPQMKKKMLFY